jgi:heat shock protein HtpX
MVSGKAALSLAGAKLADGPEYQRLRNVVEEMATAAGVPVPKTYVVDDPSPNAFATGRNPQHAAVTVTRGLLETMNRAELTGVVAHEIGHIKNRDISVTTLAVLTVGAIAVLADIAMRIALVVMATGRRGNSKEAGARAGIALIALLVSFVLYIFALPAALILRAALSRQRETLADASAVQYTRDPSGLRSALEKLEADTTSPALVSTATAHLWIDHPKPARAVQRGMLSGLLDTHPPIAQRIAILRQMEGLGPTTPI